jgi:hypothetical protein
VGAVDPIINEPLGRLKAATLRGLTLAQVPEWIVENTTLRGQPFSFKDHEYQLQIVRDQSREKVIRKCSQVGISELSARACLAVVNIIQGVTAIYTLPTASFSKTFAKTRIDPVVQGSSALRATINPTADNTEMKQFGQSFVYIRGTVGERTAISIPADLIVNDEVDFSDATVMSNYHSRLSHSPYKLKWRFSTPTVDGYGISEHFNSSRQHWNMVKCCHCNHHFIPDYFKHVRIPDFDGEMKEITKQNLHTIRYQEAWLECPACGKEPSLQLEHREWVVQNSESNFEASGYQIQPFDAPNVISLPDLIKGSTQYDRYVDFVNNGLGLPAEDKDTTLTRQELENCFVQAAASGYWMNVMGIDAGMVCHIIVSGIDGYGKMFTLHTEQVPLPRLEERKRELAMQYRVSVTVMDHQPYTDMLMRLQKSDPNLYGAVYVTSRNLAPFAMKKEEEDKDEAELQVRQVNINRNRAFDGLMEFIRRGSWQIMEDANKELIIKHLTDMKRVKAFSDDKEIQYVWQKSSQGEDHFHHTLLYCWIAGQMRGVSESRIVLPWLVSKFKVKS